MSTLLQTTEVSVAKSRSPLVFETRGPDMNPRFDRYLVLRGEDAFHVGNVCDTCEFFFERLESPSDKVSPAGVAARLREGVRNLDGELVRDVMTALPAGHYRAMLTELTPESVQSGSPADYFMSRWSCGESIPHSVSRMIREPTTTARRRCCWEGRQFF